MKYLMTGSFKPFTTGHSAVYDNACELFGADNVFIGIASNPAKDSKNSNFFWKWVNNAALPQNNPNIAKDKILIIPHNKSVAQFALDNGFGCLIRSMRNSIDLAYETQMEYWNSQLGIKTIYVPCPSGSESVSSSALRELVSIEPEIVRKHLPGGELQLNRWNKKPKRIIVTGFIGSGKSSFIEKYVYFNVDAAPIDLDKKAKHVIPKSALKIIAGIIENSTADNIKDNWQLSKGNSDIIDIASNALVKYIKSCDCGVGIPVFEASAMSSYNVESLYDDSIIIHLNKFESGKKRVIDPGFFNKMRALQEIPMVVDFVINENTKKSEIEGFLGDCTKLIEEGYAS